MEREERAEALALAREAEHRVERDATYALLLSWRVPNVQSHST